MAACFAHATAKPHHFCAALSVPHWREAMETEFDALVSNGTWNLVPPRSGIDIIDSKWVFKVERYANGNIGWYKARLVAKGF
jgi:hypothetical protein